MKYDIILSNEEVEKLLNMRYKENRNLGEIIKDLENEFQGFSIKNMEKSIKNRLLFEIGLGIGGDIKNNPKDLRCPNCNGKYVVRTYAGDLYYKLFNGTKMEREKENKRFENMELYCNPWAAADENTRDYWCLNCGIRWNGKDKDIIEYE